MPYDMSKTAEQNRLYLKYGPKVVDMLRDLLLDFESGFIAQESHNADRARLRREKQIREMIFKLTKV